MQSSNVITVYHGCNYFQVAAIATKIKILERKDPSDFSAESEQRSFYTTKMEKFARGWAESSAKDLGEVPAVIKFELNLGDLNVYDFGNETKGKLFEEWQQFVFDNYMGKPPNHRQFSGFDILMGFMSNANELVWEELPTKDRIQPHKFRDGGLMTQIAARKDKAIDMERWKVMEVTKLQNDKWIPVKKADWAKRK